MAGEPVPLEQLEETLRGALHAPDVRFVKLRGDREANLGVAVKVIDAARNAGAESLDIVTRQPCPAAVSRGGCWPSPPPCCCTCCCFSNLPANR